MSYLKASKHVCVTSAIKIFCRKFPADSEVDTEMGIFFTAVEILCGEKFLGLSRPIGPTTFS